MAWYSPFVPDVVENVASDIYNAGKDFVGDITGSNAKKAARNQQNADAAVLEELLANNPFAGQSPTQTSLTSVGMPEGQREAMEFQKAQATKEINNNMAGGGMLRSGAAAKALSDRQQGIAAQNYQQALDNALRTNDQNFRQDDITRTNQADWAINAANTRFGLNNNKRQDSASQKSAISNILSNFNPFG